VNDVKDLCEQLLDAPPPVRDATEALVIARRSTERRAAIRGTGALVAVGAAAGAAMLVVPGLTASDPAATDQGAPVAVGAPPVANASSSAPPAEVPYAQAAGTHDRKMFETVKQALPPGYTAASEYPFSTNSTPYPTDPAAPMPSGAVAMGGSHLSVLVSKDGRVGWLSAFIINDGRPVPTGDLCGPEIAKQNNDQPGSSCRVVEVNGTKIRVTREHWDNTAPEIDVITVTRYLRNGALMITESRSVPDFQSEQDPLPPDAVNQNPQKQAPTSALGDWFLTDDQLAALAADPAMLP
jgi:hypothetical protein